MLSCKIVLRQSVRQSVAGGATESLFPAVEQWLQEDGHSKVLRKMETCNSVVRYRSIIDFLTCSLFPEYQEACDRFYRDDGPPLRETITEAKMVACERWMLSVLNAAYGTRGGLCTTSDSTG